MSTNIFDRISFWALFLVITLLPVFFLPFTNIPIEIGKGAFVVLGLAISIVFWAIGRFSDGSIVLPKSPVLFAGLGLVFTLLLSTLFSESSAVSFFGTMFDVGTFWFMFACFLLMLMSAAIFRDSKKVSILLMGIVFSSLFVLIFQTLYLFLPQKLGLGVLVGKTDNIIGGWNAFGFFAGLSSLIALFVIEFFEVSRVVKWILVLLLFWSLAMVAVVASANFTLVWILIGIFSLVIFIYKASISYEDDGNGGKKIKFPIISFAVVTLALLFFMSGPDFRGFLSNKLDIASNEVSPTFKSTALIAKSVLQTNPILGIGPNRFSEAWSLYKPAQINETQFWDVAFNSGSGLLPTIASTTGVLGLLSLLVFFAFFLIAGVQSIFSSMRRGFNYTLMAFFVVAFYLFVVSFFYSSGSVLILLAFAFTGVFIGFSSGESKHREIYISFLDDHRKSFFGMMFLIFIMMSSVVATVKYGERFASVIYFRKALAAPTVEVANAAISRAVSLYPNDLYLKTYAQVYLLKMNELSKKEEASLSEAEKTEIRTNLDQAVSGARLATEYNPKNYVNFQDLGSIYQSLASLGVKEANAKAIEAYKVASTLNPLNPRIKLVMASASFSDGKVEDAKTYANEALTLKPDYLDALVVLIQIAQSEKDNTSALAYAEKALVLIPDNEELQKYVESLRGGNKVAPLEEIKDETPVEKAP